MANVLTWGKTFAIVNIFYVLVYAGEGRFFYACPEWHWCLKKVAVW